MKTILPILLIAGMTTRQVVAGNITGKVHAEGKPAAETGAAGGGKYDSHEFKFVEKVNYADMHDFIVCLVGAMPGQKSVTIEKPVQVTTEKVARKTTEQVSQKKAEFLPHVLPVMVGTTVEWPNNDDIFHNVFSYSEAKTFDLDLYKKPTVKSVVFDKPGRVDVFCSIHANMSCVVLVLENPFFAATNDKGVYTIANVPAGKYTVRAWHERLPAREQEIVVPETGEVKLDFTLGITGLPKY